MGPRHGPEGPFAAGSPPAGFVVPALDFAAAVAGLLEAGKVFAAEVDGETFALVAAPLEDGDFFEGRVHAPEAARTGHGSH